MWGDDSRLKIGICSLIRECKGLDYIQCQSRKRGKRSGTHTMTTGFGEMMIKTGMIAGRLELDCRCLLKERRPTMNLVKKINPARNPKQCVNENSRNASRQDDKRAYPGFTRSLTLIHSATHSLAHPLNWISQLDISIGYLNWISRRSSKAPQGAPG